MKVVQLLQLVKGEQQCDMKAKVRPFNSAPCRFIQAKQTRFWILL